MKELEIEIKETGIYFNNKAYKFTDAQKTKLVKDLTAYHGAKTMDQENINKVLLIEKESALDLSKIKNTPKEFLFDYILPNKQINYDDEHETLKSNISGFEVSESDLDVYISTANDEYIKLVGKEAPTWTNMVLLNTFKEFKLNSFHESVLNIRNEIKYDEANSEYISSTDESLDELFEAMNISKSFKDLNNEYSTDNYREIAKLVFKQIIWLIKRNLFNLPTKNEMMMFFFGSQGIGKTYAFNKIFKTMFKGLYIGDCKLDTLLEDRQVELWTRKLVVNFDDASASGNVSFNTKNMGEIKSKLSNDTITYRPMGTNESKTVSKKFTAVSTTNIDFKELIQDSTGARRFFQLISDNETNELFDDKYFDGSDIEEKMRELWMSVDENNKNGFLFDRTNPLVLELDAIQRTYIKVDTVTEFFDEYKFCKSENESLTATKLSFTSAYRDYKNYCEENGIKHVLKQSNFKAKLLKEYYTDEEVLRNGKVSKQCFYGGSK